jgi:hypothetical protein
VTGPRRVYAFPRTHAYVSAFPLDAHSGIAASTRRTVAQQAGDLVFLRPPRPSRIILRRADALSRAQRWAAPNDDDDDDDDDFVVLDLTTFLQTRTLLGAAVRSVLIAAARCHADTVHGGDDTAAPRPSRCVAASGTEAECMRVGALASIIPSPTATSPSSS